MTKPLLDGPGITDLSGDGVLELSCTIGPDIRTIRHSLKMTQRELAELTWRSDAATISDWETGKTKCPQHVYQRLLKMIGGDK